ncbi:MAG TPA: carboxypeptidase-like regulatory domain-containing protein [Terracidiphilus sp.]|nr:carboxypeptidase-like regulatory domain-containing protein [Terracidiphilus sp.]
MQAQSPAPPAATATLRGNIADPTGAFIPGAKITITNALGVTVKTTTSDAAGAYTVTGLAPGGYIVQASVDGFAPFSSPTIQLAASQTKRVDISMAIEAAEQSVTVSDEAGPTVSVDAGSNASSLVLKGQDLDALSDDPDELSNELSALAGPSAGPNGGQIYIDGFTGGTLPPKSAIREIRINQNPFSAEFDHIGYGRIEILTKPGTDVLHGRGFLMGNDSAFNTGNPFLKPVPAYHAIQYNGSISGSINKKTSFFLSVEGRNIQDQNIYIASTAVLDPSTDLYSIPTDSNGNIIPTTGSIYSPSTRIEISPRIDLQLGDKNTLTMRYQFEHTSSTGSLNGSTYLPTRATSGTSTENAIQLMDSQIINDRIVNETRFQYRRGLDTTTPVSAAPSVGVSGNFAGGGSSGQHDSNHTDHLELQNITTMSAGAHAIKFGTWMRDNRVANSSNANFNGSFSFPSLQAYVDTLNGLAQGETMQQIAASCPPSQKGGCIPNQLTYTTGPQGFTANVYDAALFLQDDWKFNQFLTLSGGLRWETQNHTADHSDWGPRVAFAYALDGHKNRKQAKTVVRGGYGFFYDRFQTGSLMSLEQLNGGPNSQTMISIANPACFNATSLSSISGGLASCGSGKTVAPVINQIAPGYRSPNMQQFGTSLERQLSKASTLTLTYMHSFGVHQMATRDSNAYLPGVYNYANPANSGSRPNPNLGVVKEFYPEAVFKENQLIVNINARFTPSFSVMGFYNLTYANSNTGTASNSYNLSQDYGRATFAARQMLFLMSNYSGPWGLTFNPFLIAQAGRPFNITTNNDLTGDTFFNDRPSFASAASIASDIVHTNIGDFDTVPQPGETMIPANMGNGPAAVAVNLRVSRSIGIGPKVEGTAGPNRGGPPMGGGGGRGGDGGGRGGGGFGGGPFGGGGGGMRGGMSNTGRKYSLTFSAQALNLFNDINYGPPSGSLIPTLDATTGLYGPGSRFEKSTSLARGIFASPTSSAARRIFFQAAFTF